MRELGHTKVPPGEVHIRWYWGRLQEAPLSLGPSCMTQKKTTKKWSRENLGARSTPPGSYVDIFLCRAQRTKRITHDKAKEGLHVV